MPRFKTCVPPLRTRPSLAYNERRGLVEVEEVVEACPLVNGRVGHPVLDHK